MADPVAVEVAGGVSATATTTVSFAAQPAGALLLLHVVSDDYRLASGSGRPESSGWTLLQFNEGNLGHYFWWKLAAGSETSVQYTIGSASRSAFAVSAVSSIDQTTPVDGSAKNLTGVDGARTTHTTPAVTVSAGRRIAFGSVGAAGNNAITGMSGWTNGYTEIHDRQTTAGYRDAIGVAYLILDGGVSTSTTATISASTDQQSGFTAVFNAATGGSGSFPVVGTVGSVSAAQGVVTSRRPVLGVVPSASTVSGVVAAKRAVIGMVSSVSSITGVLSQGLSGRVESGTLVTGQVTTRRPVVGVVATVSTITGQVTAALPVKGTVAAVSTVTGSMEPVGGLAGTVTATSAVAGSVAAKRPVTGVVSSASTVTGSMDVPGGLSGTITAASTVSGRVTARLSVGGTVHASSTVTGSLTAKHAVYGTVLTVSSLTGDMIPGGLPPIPDRRTLVSAGNTRTLAGHAPTRSLKGAP